MQKCLVKFLLYVIIDVSEDKTSTSISDTSASFGITLQDSCRGHVPSTLLIFVACFKALTTSLTTHDGQAPQTPVKRDPVVAEPALVEIITYLLKPVPRGR